MEHKELLRIIGSRIKELRKARGWTQAELATRARVTTDFLGKAERGDKEPSLYVILKLATAFDVTPAFLLTPGPDQSPNQARLVALIAGRDSSEVEWLEQFIAFLAEHPLRNAKQSRSGELPKKKRPGKSAPSAGNAKG